MDDVKIPVDLSKVSRIASRLVEEFGSAYKYTDWRGDVAPIAQCVNTHDGKPMCIVGHILSEIFGVENIRASGSSETTIPHLIRKGHTFKTQARLFLAVAQSLQDQGATWYHAVIGANAAAYMAKHIDSNF